MKERHALLYIAVAILVATVGFSHIWPRNESLVCLACASRVVDKSPNEDFIVDISFRNIGRTEGGWSVNIAFEGEFWTWSGVPKTLTLKSCEKKTLTWKGNVPEMAPVDSVARLIVYYNDSFEGLDWWIHVVNGTELAIASSRVK